MEIEGSYMDCGRVRFSPIEEEYSLCIIYMPAQGICGH